jgi:hypothetical protein
MTRAVISAFIIQFVFVFMLVPARAASVRCEQIFTLQQPTASAPIAESTTLQRLFSPLKAKAIKTILQGMAYFKGLPKYFNRIEQLRQSGDYLKYHNFGEMGLAEIGISVRYNKANFESLNTGRPLVIIGNHHLGIADGLTLQHISSQARREKPSLLFLARWIEKLLPHAVFGDEQGWGTAIPVDINTPKPTDPLYDSKMAEIKAFNSTWSRTSLKALRGGGALIIFPAGHVAAINEGGGSYPTNVFDAPNSWQEGFLSLARIGKADIVFANVKSVNSESFYKNRKRFGGGDLERVIWFFSEALAKKDQVIDVELSKPMSLDEIYDKLAEVYGHPRETLEADPALAAELMRQYTYQLSVFSPQTLDTTDSPQRK